MIPPSLAGVGVWSPSPSDVRRWAARLAGAAALAMGLMTAYATSAIAEPSVTYQVRPGDTLSAIAEGHGWSVSGLARANGIVNPNLIRVGQVLRLTAASDPRDAASDLTMKVNLGVTTNRREISAPYFNQFDGTVWGPSNCGPTALATALGGIGIHATPTELRALANRQMRSFSPSNGTTWEALAYGAHQRGAITSGLYRGRYYRSWTTDELKTKLAAGHPVLLLVRYRALPDHAQSRYWGDHYITALGFDAAGYLQYDDPATPNGVGRYLSPAQLEKAWSRTSVGLVRTAMALERR